jgi:hypothetical protein
MTTTRACVLYLLLGLLAFSLILPAAPERAEALSGMARQRMLTANPDFAAAETALDRAWENLAGALPRPAVTPYLENLLRWRNQERDQTVRAVYEKFLDNPSALPGSLLDAQGLPSLSTVYAKVTLERANLMAMAAAQFKNEKLTLAVPGWIERVGGHGRADSHYTLTPYGWVTPLYLGTAKELTAIHPSAREQILKLPDSDYDTLVILKGRLDDELRGFSLRSGLALETPEGMGWMEWSSQTSF